MRLPTLIALAATVLSSSAAAQDVQYQIQSIQIDILDVINDLVQGRSAVGDYQSTADQLRQLQSSIMTSGDCSNGQPASPADQNEVIADLQNVQLQLSQVSSDLLNSNDQAAVNDLCSARLLYDSVSGSIN